MVLGLLMGMALAQGPSTPLGGTVVGPDGSPVVGAELVLAGPTPGESPVLARGKSGEGGRFRLDRPAGLGPTNRYLVPTLWAYARGHRVVATRFDRAMPGADEPVRVVLGPPSRTEVRVEAPDGSPVAGARLSVQTMQGEALPVPDPIAELAEAATGPDGRAVLDAFGGVGNVDVIARGFGTQPRWLDPAVPGPKAVRLRPVVTLKGRLVPDKAGPGLAQGWRVRAWTRDEDAEPRSRVSAGYASATTDAEGRFTLDELAVGLLQFTVDPPAAADVLPDIGPLKPVRQGQEDVLEIPLRRASTVTGLVREHGTGRPVAGVEFSLSHLRKAGSSPRGKTDAEGRYAIRTLPGELRLSQMGMPPTHVAAPGPTWRDFTAAGEPRRIEMEPREVLVAAAPLRGEVRDEAGRPVAGADVQGQWTASTPLGVTSGTSMATTDGQGRFALAGLAPGARVAITARLADRTNPKPMTADAGSDRPLTVAIVPQPTVAVAGAVLGPGGRPVAGAVVRVKVREANRQMGRPNSFEMQATFRRNDQIRSGPDGRFRTPRELDREGKEFQAEASASGYLTAQTPWVPAGEGDVVTLPALTLRRLTSTRDLSGRVVDRDGRPVAGATAFQAGDGPRRTSATTDDAGRFRLGGVYAGGALVFAEKAGFRFGGAVAGPGGGDVEVVLAREGGPPASRPAALPSPLPRAEERAMGRDLLGPVLPAFRAGSLDDFAARRVLLALARVDPGRVLAMIEDRVIATSSAILFGAAVAQLEDDPREAIATIESDLDPGSRAGGFLALAAADRARRDELLGRALAEARRVADPETKMTLLGQVAGRWLDLGDPGRAGPILREAKAILDGMPGRGHSFSIEQFGEVLAAIDLPAARAIFERVGMAGSGRPDEATVRRHLGEAAVRIAATDPAEAERLSVNLGGPNPGSREQELFRLARRMAVADLPRARRLLAASGEHTGNPAFARQGLVPYGLGLMAAARAASDPASARGLLDEAFAGLLRVARDGDGQPNPPASVLMAALLPTVERVDPDRLAERLWLAASCRPPRTQAPPGHDVTAMLTLALLASRYDRAMAAAIAEPALDRLPSLVDGSDPMGRLAPSTFDVLAAYDPRAIDATIRSLPDVARRPETWFTGQTSTSQEILARLSAAEMFGLPIEDRRGAGLEKFGYLYGALPEGP